MGDVKIPNWLKKLPLAPEFHPTDSEFADPIAYISKIEKEASAFGICKVIPPLPKPSKKSVFYNLKKSLSKSPELGPSPSASLLDQLGCRDEGNGEARAVFTTRHQELGSSSRKTKGQTTAHKQVWQSGEVYTLEQFESKSKAFARNQLGAIKEVTPLVVEALFWKAASEKPIYIEYANDVPGSGFGEPEDIGQYFHKRRRRKLNEKGQAGCEYETGVASNSYNDAVRDASVKNDSDPSLATSENLSSQKQKVPSANNDREGTAGWKLSNCPWNLQVIARSPGSLTRFMVDDIPGVTSPMIYIGMLFSWFAWHVEDHELHSLNYLHTGSPKTWYAVPGNYAFTFEEAIRAQGYGGNLDRLAALTLLGEKTNLLSPEVVVASGIPCCRLVQNPGEFVVTFPRAYHVGFSHGFNCGEAANFGTPQWLKVAKEAAVRRAAMNYLPMLSHQQLLYLLTMSFVSSVPKALLQGARISRLKDRQKEERELLVKKAFIDDMLNQNNLLWELLGKESSSCAILWDPDLLPMPSNVSQSVQMCANPDPSGLMVGQRDAVIHIPENEIHVDIVHDETSNISNMSNGTLSVDLLNSADICNSSQSDSPKLHVENSEGFSVYDDDLPCGLHVDSGTLPCVACGILGFPFMAIVQPSQKATVEFFPAECQMIHDGLGVLRSVKHHAPLAGDQTEIKFFSDGQPDDNCGRHECISEASNYEMDVRLTEICLEKSFTGAVGSSSQGTQKIGLNTFSFLHQIRTSPCVEPNDTADAKFSEVSRGLESCSSSKVYKKWNTSSRYFRPRVFCLEHALETEKLLRARGGADVLIICHSAYRKIKAHALAVAEEIALPYTCSEVPLENASKEELDLINVSICDESHEECVEDWTSKLGLNLSYCVNLRKLSEAKQEPALPLGGLFSEIISGSNLSKLDVSSLKWNSRRARSHKATVRKESIPCQSTQIKGDIPVEKQERSKVAGENKIIFQYSRRKCTKNKTAQNFPSNQQPEAESRRYGHPDDNVVSIDALCSIDNTRIVSSKLGKCSPLSGNKQHEECIGKESEMSEISCPAKSLIHEKKGNDSAQLVRSSNAYHSGVQQEHYTIEETREDLSNPVNPDGSLTIENAGNDSDKLTSVENLEILHEALTTGETMEVCKVSDRENTEDLLHNGRTGGDAVELIDEKQENNMCMVDETGMVGEEFDCAKSAVLHAIYDLVVQNLETQIRSQIFEDLEVEYSRLQHKVRIADRELSNSSDPAETIESPDVASSFVDNNGEQEIDSIEEEFKGSKVSSSWQDGMSPESAHTKRSQNKRKREIEQLTEEDVGTNGFIRSPCEGLRPRTSRNTTCLTGSDDGTKVETACKKARRSPNGSIFSTEKKAKETNRVHRCDLEGCQMTFETKDELNMHQSNRCTHEGCNKQFSSHKYTLSHQKVHIDERPLKCEWKGCKMSFKWTWARTEHMRVHTGERPYKCKTEGCGRTFRFVSDSSRHRRKTGHRMSPSR